MHTPASANWQPVLPRSAGALRSSHREWFFGTLACTALLVLCLSLMAVDERTLNGVSVWKKPAKFALSTALYLGTLACFAALLPASFWRGWEGRVMTWLAIATTAFELTYITFMAALGEPSHFNTSTPLTASMYSLMGLAAVLLVAVSPWLAVAIARHCRGWTRDPMRLAIVAGLVLTGLLGGGFGGYLGGAGGHWVGGTPSDAAGLPGFDWSRDGGDLRVAHFFGMHAMQALPLMALVAIRLGRHLPRLQLSMVALSGVSYVALTLFSFVQALAGKPFP